MSGKTARRLRRLTEQAMNAQHGSTTIRPYEDDRAYKKVPVLANRKKDLSYASSNTTEVIKVDQKNPRAFYQQAKKMYKSGEAQREAERIEREYREDQMKAANNLQIPSKLLWKVKVNMLPCSKVKVKCHILNR